LQPPTPLRFKLAACALAAGGFATAVAAEAQPIGRAEIVALSHSVGRVEARLDDGRVGVGSAITVAQGVLVTKLPRHEQGALDQSDRRRNALGGH